MKLLLNILISIFLLNNITLSQNKILFNLDAAKKTIKNYYTNGDYDREIEQNINDALLNLSQIEIPKNAAFVFDVDETALSNMSYELQYDFAYIPKYWDIWVDSAKAPAIPQVKRFYDTLIKKGVSVIFLTGRHSGLYDKTVFNLKNEGYTKFDTLICKTPEFKGKKAVDYKTEIRKKLSEKYKIIGSIGDQWSDSEGGYTIMKVKIPNLMYYIE